MTDYFSPPSADTEAERAVVAACLVDGTILDDVGSLICSADFGDMSLGRLFDALAIIREAGLPTNDVVVLTRELRSQRVPECVCTPLFLAGLIGEGIASNSRYYAQRIKDASALRKLHDAAKETLVRINASGVKPGDVRRWLDSVLTGVDDVQLSESRSVKDLAKSLLEELKASPPHERCLMSGIAGHDEFAGGWMPGELIVLAARTGVGKTALATQIARHNAEHGRAVLFVSLEMRGTEIVGRIICGDARINSRRLRSTQLEPWQMLKLGEAVGNLGDIPLFVWSPPRASMSQIRGMCRRFARQRGLSLLIVDYVGLVQATSRKIDRHEQVGQITGDLKALARELAIPVVALHQLNREADKGLEPKLSQLRESGSVEQDADVVLFLNRHKTGVNLIVAKHRHGETGKIELAFDGMCTKFTDKEPANRETKFDDWNRN